MINNYKLLNNCFNILQLYFVSLSLFHFFFASCVEMKNLSSQNKNPLRIKREGFGPWESQDTWDKEGKSNVIPTIQMLINSTISSDVFVQAEKIFDEIVEIVEHPVRELTKTKLGWFVIFFLSLCVFSFLVPFLRLLFNGIGFIFTRCLIPISKFFVKNTFLRTSCILHFCALKPCLKFRNWYIKRKYERQAFRNLQIYKPSEEIQMIKKTISDVYTDEQGVYLLAENNQRVYLNPEKQPKDFLSLYMLGTTNREKGFSTDTIKESVLPTSKLYKVDSIPDFQGTFEVDGQLIGHFSRIRFNGLDCLLTAYHVLDYNKRALINMRKGDKCVCFNSIDAKVVAASHSDQYDFLVLAVPSCVFSTLGMKIGTWTTRIQPREAIQIYQFYDGKPCVSSAAITSNSNKPWHVSYAASTIVGTSGAPLLDCKRRIVGVHLEHEASSKLNVGVIPPIFKMSLKESPTNENLDAAWNLLSRYDSLEPIDEDFNNPEYIEMEAYVSRYQDTIDVYEKGTSWADYMDDFDRNVQSEMKQKYGEKFDIFQTRSNSQKGHIGTVIKSGRIRKESPWSCSKCGFVQKQGFNCTRCGFALIPSTEKTLDNQAKGIDEAKNFLQTQLPVEITDKIIKHAFDKHVINAIAREVADILRTYKDNADYLGFLALQTELESKFYNFLPTSQKIDISKNLLEEIRTKEPVYPIQAVVEKPLTVDSDNNLAISSAKIVDTSDGLINIKKCSNPIVGLNPVKGENKYTRRRNRTSKNKKETQIASAVPLNEQAPVQSGGPITHGLNNPFNSQLIQQKLDEVKLPSKVQSVEKKARNGKNSAKLNQSTISTHGHLAEQLPRK